MLCTALIAVGMLLACLDSSEEVLLASLKDSAKRISEMAKKASSFKKTSKRMSKYVLVILDLLQPPQGVNRGDSFLKSLDDAKSLFQTVHQTLENVCRMTWWEKIRKGKSAKQNFMQIEEELDSKISGEG